MHFFKKRNTGYTPWVAKKAPLFNASLNATYVRLSGVLIFVLFVFTLGLFSGLALSSKSPSMWTFTSFDLFNKETPKPKLVAKPPQLEVKKITKVEMIIDPTTTVPAIPMTLDINIKPNLALPVEPATTKLIGPSNIGSSTSPNEVLKSKLDGVK